MPTGDPRDCITYTYSASTTNNTGTWNVYPNDVWIGDPPASPWDWPSTTPYIQQQPYTYPNITVPWMPNIPEEKKEDIGEIIRKALEADKQNRKSKEGLMKVFEVLVIDKRECKVLDQKVIVAQDRETAMLELDLAPEVRAKVKKNEIEFIFTERGSFTKVERKVKISDLKDEE